jgi:hypothetical protein
MLRVLKITKNPRTENAGILGALWTLTARQNKSLTAHA